MRKPKKEAANICENAENPRRVSQRSLFRGSVEKYSDGELSEADEEIPEETDQETASAVQKKKQDDSCDLDGDDVKLMIATPRTPRKVFKVKRFSN